MTEVIEASGFLLITQQEPRQFLLMKHRDRWDLPKGHAEQGEGLLECALRETCEETGIQPTEIDVDAEFRFSIEYDVRHKRRGTYHKRTTYFLGYVEKPLKIELTEHIGYEWMTWPPTGNIQAETIDPLLAAVKRYL